MEEGDPKQKRTKVNKEKEKKEEEEKKDLLQSQRVVCRFVPSAWLRRSCWTRRPVG